MKEMVIILGFVLMLSHTKLSAQSQLKVFTFNHDNAGNRTSRTVPPGREGVSDTTYTKAINGTYKISVFPNPTDDFINIRIIDFADTSWQYKIYDIKGTLLQNEIANGTDEKAYFSLYPTGMYILRIIVKKEQFEYKILKQ